MSSDPNKSPQKINDHFSYLGVKYARSEGEKDLPTFKNSDELSAFNKGIANACTRFLLEVKPVSNITFK